MTWMSLPKPAIQVPEIYSELNRRLGHSMPDESGQGTDDGRTLGSWYRGASGGASGSASGGASGGASGRGPLIGLHPLDSGGETRRWPLERYQALMFLLWERLRAGLILHGGPADGPVLEALASAHPGPVLVRAGATCLPLDALAATLGAEDCFVVGDTGPMHLAAALDVPGVALFGSTDPALTGPYGGEFTLLHRAPSRCEGCYRRACPTRLECLTALSVEEVFDAVVAQLGKATP